MNEMLFAVIGATFGVLFINHYGEWKVVEPQRQEIFNRGVEHGICITVKALESAEAADQCFERLER